MLHRPPLPTLPPVCFENPELAGALDVRRWREGERNTRRRRSPIQGFGSFAARPISRGAPVLVREPRSGNFPVNHSDFPNTMRATNRAGLFALRDIAAGEEITEDYRFLPYFEQRIPVTPLDLRTATPEEYERLLTQWHFIPPVEPELIVVPTRLVPAEASVFHPSRPLLCGPR